MGIAKMMGRKARCVGVAVGALLCSLLVLHYQTQLSTAYSGVMGPDPSSSILATNMTASPRRAPLAWFVDPGRSNWTARQLLIFTYGRSGSSFTGDIVHHHPNVYYAFEPLHGIYINDGAAKRAQHEVMQAIFRCNYSTKAVWHLNDPFIKGRKQGTSDVYRCLELKGKHSPQPTIKECMQKAERSCQRYALKAVKTIRMSMDQVGQLMALNPDLAVIFLLRDVRARVWSTIKAFHKPGTVQELQPRVQGTCQTLRHDLTLFQELFQQYPARMRVLRYEDLAQDPLRISRNMYRFLHLSWSDKVRSLIEKQSSQGANNTQNINNNVKRLLQGVSLFKDTSKAYSVVRPNSALAAVKWQVEIPVSVLKTVQSECGGVLVLLGYRPFGKLQDYERGLGNRTTSAFKLAEQLPFRADLNY